MVEANEDLQVTDGYREIPSFVKNAINSKGGIRRGTILGRLSNVDDFRLVGNRQASSQIAKGAGKSLALLRREV